MNKIPSRTKEKTVYDYETVKAGRCGSLPIIRFLFNLIIKEKHKEETHAQHVTAWI